MDHTDRINNWDLVDLSAPYIMGEFIEEALNHPASYRRFDAKFFNYFKSSSIWEQRIGIVSYLPVIRRGDYHMILSFFPPYLLEHARWDEPGAKPNATRLHDLNQKGNGLDIARVGQTGRRYPENHFESLCREDAPHHASLCDREADTGGQEEVYGEECVAFSD